MKFDQPDFLRPIRDDNRDEYILVEFHRTFVNTNMSILENIFQAYLKDKSLLYILPDIAHYATLDPNKMYDATVLFNHPYQMIKSISRDQLSVELSQKYAETFQEPYHFSHLHHTRLEFMLREMLEHSFVKTIYIFAPKFTDEMKSYLQNIFEGKGLGSRILLVEGNFKECISEISQITTIFMSNVEDLIQVYNENPHLLDGKYILISDGYENMTADEKDPSQLTYVGLDLFQHLLQDRKCMISYIYPNCIEKNLSRKEEPQ